MKRLISLVVLMLPVASHGAIIVRGNDTTAPFAFKTAIQSQTYDRRSGMFFVGLTSGTDTYTISKANRPTFASLASFSPVLTATDPLMLQTSSIEFLAFSPQTNAKQVLTGVAQDTNPQSSKRVFGLFTDGSEQQETADLNDAAGATTEGIINIAASDSYVFATVAASGSVWGDTDSGIALIGIGATNSTLTLSTKNAPAGIDGNVATKLDSSSPQLGTSLVITNTLTPMVWDDELQRLFIGVSVLSGASGTDVVKSVVVARLVTGALTLQTIVPNSAADTTDQIVITQGAAQQLQTEHIGVLHASTGPDYLIVNCSKDGACNRIFALPLVNNVDDPTNALNGTLAPITSTLDSNNKFTTAASAPADLAINNATTNPAAVVGAGDLPIKTDDGITNLKIVGDGVYVSINDNDGASVVDSDRGIFYSQAMFDNTGKIIRWTPWTQRVIPFNAFPTTNLPGGSTHNGAVNFFEIDGKTGNVWFVEGTTGTTVGITSWSTGESTNGLLKTLGTKMFNGVYSILDLDQATRGFLGTTLHRYALFGGVNKVAFARVSQATALAEGGTDQSYNSSPQATITDFSLNSNFLVSNLPDGAGCCQVLEYSRTSTGADGVVGNTDLNYFFAGTQNGLFVFNVNDAGFDPENLSTLDSTPFSDGSWRKIETIPGEIIDIKTTGANGTNNGVGVLYVIANQSTPTCPLQSTLYAIPFAPTLTSMFASGNIRILAQTGVQTGETVGNFSNVLQFYGVQPIATGNALTSNAGNKEQLILATNQGLFYSDADQSAAAGDDGILVATTQTQAKWNLLQNSSKTTATTMYNGIAGPNTPIRQTAWPFNLKDKANFNIFDRGNINQLSGFGEPTTDESEFNTFFIPPNFNANSTSSSFNTLDRIIDFFSDGGRRFFIFNRTQDPPTQVKIGVLPYEVNVWNITQPDILSHPTLNTLNQFYAIQNLGSTGILIAGTQTGAVGLE